MLKKKIHSAGTKARSQEDSNSDAGSVEYLLLFLWEFRPRMGATGSPSPRGYFHLSEIIKFSKV